MKNGSKSPASASEVFGENAQSRSQSSSSRHRVDTQQDRFAEWAVFFVLLVFVTLFLVFTLTHLLSCLSEPQRQTRHTRQTQTDKTAPPRDTEKTVKSDATETKDTKLLHVKFQTRKFQCDEFSTMFQVVFHLERHPTSKMHPYKQPKITLQTHPYRTSDYHFFMNSLSFYILFIISKIIVAYSVFLLLNVGPFLHEKFIIWQLGTFLQDPRRQQEKVHMTFS